MNKVFVMISILLFASCFFSGCLDQKEELFEKGTLSIHIESNYSQLPENGTVSINYILSNIGDTTVRIIKLEYYFYDQLLIVRNPNGSIVRPVMSWAPPTDPTNVHLIEFHPDEVSIVSFNLTSNHYPFLCGNSYKIQGRYSLGNISTIGKTHWKGEIYSEIISLSIN